MPSPRQYQTASRPAVPLPVTRRASERRRVRVPGRVTWRDARGMTRFASVVLRDVSDNGAYLECGAADPIPMYRLVYLQLEREGRDSSLPPALVQGRVLAAVYRVGPRDAATGTPAGYAVRFVLEGAGPLARPRRSDRASHRLREPSMHRARHHRLHHEAVLQDARMGPEHHLRVAGTGTRLPHTAARARPGLGRGALLTPSRAVARPPNVAQVPSVT
jgi:hypothetical protein